MKTIALLAGGDSGEYEISIKTAQNIHALLDKEQFCVYFIIVKGGSWSYETPNGEQYLIDKNDFSLTIRGDKIKFDVAFIAIHGTPGENGKLQAYFEMLAIPYTGCDSFCSAITFNKYFCNIVVEKCGINIAPSLHYYSNDFIDIKEIIHVCGLPCFVKPCNSGSSVGVTKAHDPKELLQALASAFHEDEQIIIEKYIEGRELTCGVAKINGKIKALAVTEIKSKKEYYDFEAKYTPGYLELVTPAELEPEVETKINHYSELIYKKLGCKGVVRIDYIMTVENKPYFLEINTIPGQTAMSIIPKQLKHNGIDLVDFYGELVLEALNKKDIV